MGVKSKIRRELSLRELLFAHDFRRFEMEPWSPNMDLAETQDEIVVHMELPGVLPEEVRVVLSGRTLQVEGAKRETEFPASQQIRFLCLERGYGQFKKSAELPWVIDPARMSAVLGNGILTIRLAKLAERRGAVFEIPVRASEDE